MNSNTPNQDSEGIDIPMANAKSPHWIPPHRNDLSHDQSIRAIHSFNTTSSYHTSQGPSYDTRTPIPSLPTTSSGTGSNVSMGPPPSLQYIAPSQQNQYVREYYAPRYPNSYFDPESQSHQFISNQIPETVQASYRNPGSKTSYSSLSSSAPYNSDPTPPNHTLHYFQNQQDDLKRNSIESKIEKERMLQALEIAAKSLVDAKDQIKKQNEIINKLESKMPSAWYQHPVEDPRASTIPDIPISATSIVDLFKIQHQNSEYQQSPKFPKFYGKNKSKFKSWYDQVIAVLSCPPWSTVFHDIPSEELKTDENIPQTLSSKLFYALRLAVSGNAEKLMMTKKQSWGKGLLYLSILKSPYKEKLYRTDLLKTETEFANLFIR